MKKVFVIVLTLACIPQVILAHKTQYDYPVAQQGEFTNVFDQHTEFGPASSTPLGGTSNSDPTGTPPVSTGPTQAEIDALNQAQHNADQSATTYTNVLTDALINSGATSQQNTTNIQNTLNGINNALGTQVHILGTLTVEQEIAKLLKDLESSLPNSVVDGGAVAEAREDLLDRARTLDGLMPSDVEAGGVKGAGANKGMYTSDFDPFAADSFFVIGGLLISKKVVYAGSFTLGAIILAGGFYIVRKRRLAKK